MNIKERDLYVGSFWFADEPDNKVYGYIKKDLSGEFKLTLEGPFKKKTSYVVHVGTVWSEKSNRIINGKISNDATYPEYVCVTLSGLSYFDGGEPVKEYRFRYMIFDYHFTDQSEICFNKISFSFDGLLEFIGEGSFQKQVEKTDNITKELITFDKDKLFFWEHKINTFNMSIFVSGRSSEDRSNFQINSKYYHILKSSKNENIANIKLKFDNETNIEDIEKILSRIKQFFSLNFQAEVKLNDVALYRDELIKDKVYNLDQKIIFNQGFLAENDRKDISNNKKMLFSLKCLKDDFVSIMSKWLNDDEKERIYNIYFNLLGNRSLNVENQFLNSIQAIEGLANIILPPWENPFKSEIDGKIKGYFSAEEKKFVAVINSKSLEGKLREIGKVLGFKMKDVSSEISFIDITGLRNNLSHGNKISGDIYKVYNCSQICKMILDLLIIKELGISDIIFSSIKEERIKELRGDLK